MGRSLAARIKAANAELLVNGHLELLGEFFTPDYVAHGTDRSMEGHDAIRKYLRMVRRAFPVIQIEVDVLVEGKDRVAWQRRLQATQQGSQRQGAQDR